MNQLEHTEDGDMEDFGVPAAYDPSELYGCSLRDGYFHFPGHAPILAKGSCVFFEPKFPNFGYASIQRATTFENGCIVASESLFTDVPEKVLRVFNHLEAQHAALSGRLARPVRL